jgi:hypothetical protein
MRLSLRDSLPFVTVILSQAGKQIQIPDVLVDTGSGGTIFAADKMEQIGIAAKVIRF